MTSEPTAADVVMDVLNKRGWCQGDMEDLEGRVCLMGAFNKAAPWVTRSYEVESFYLKVVHYLNERYDTSIACFNDAPGRSLEDIMMVLKEVASDG